MENGVEALKLASSVLIFVIAITITISVFTSATQALNRIFTAGEAEEYVTDAEGNYLNFVRFDGGTRKVNVETVIPAIYRAYKERYAIYFFNEDGTEFPIYQNKDDVNINYINLADETYGDSSEITVSINKLLYEENDLYPYTLYETLKTLTFIEKLGEYYEDDVAGETEASEVNKTKSRVIVYTVTSD